MSVQPYQAIWAAFARVSIASMEHPWNIYRGEPLMLEAHRNRCRPMNWITTKTQTSANVCNQLHSASARDRHVPEIQG